MSLKSIESQFLMNLRKSLAINILITPYNRLICPYNLLIRYYNIQNTPYKRLLGYMLILLLYIIYIFYSIS